MELGELSRAIGHPWSILWPRVGKLEERKDVGRALFPEEQRRLRHTFATQQAENGTPESTMLALMGHMSRAMLEHYSHIRLKAKREVVAAVTLRRATNLEAVPGKVPGLTERRALQSSLTHCKNWWAL
jgi:hypothetical protein